MFASSDTHPLVRLLWHQADRVLLAEVLLSVKALLKSSSQSLSKWIDLSLFRPL